MMTTVGKELAAKGCKPAVATAVRKLTYRGKRKTAKERDLGKAMRWEDNRTSAGRAGRRPAKHKRAKCSIDDMRLRELLIPVTAPTRFWHRRLDTPQRSMTCTARQAYIQIQGIREHMTYQNFVHRLGVKSCKIGIRRQQKREAPPNKLRVKSELNDLRQHRVQSELNNLIKIMMQNLGENLLGHNGYHT